MIPVIPPYFFEEDDKPEDPTGPEDSSYDIFEEFSGPAINDIQDMIENPEVYFFLEYPENVPSSTEGLESLTPPDDPNIMSNLFFQIGNCAVEKDMYSGWSAEDTGDILLVQHIHYNCPSYGTNTITEHNLTLCKDKEKLPEGLQKYAGKTITMNNDTGDPVSVDGNLFDSAEVSSFMTALDEIPVQETRDLYRYEVSASQNIVSGDTEYDVNFRVIGYGNEIKGVEDECAVYGSITPAYNGISYFSGFMSNGLFSAYLSSDDGSSFDDKWYSFINMYILSLLKL